MTLRPSWRSLLLVTFLGAAAVVAVPRPAESQAAPPPACNERTDNCGCDMEASLECGVELGTPPEEPSAPEAAPPRSMTPPTAEWRSEDLYPACTRARLQDPTACSALECTPPGGAPGTGWFYNVELVDTATGEVLAFEVVCRGPAEPFATPALPTIAEVLGAAEVPEPQIGGNPEGRGLTGLASWFWVEGATDPVEVDVMLRGWTVSGSLGADEWRWQVGDAAYTSAGPGSEAAPAVEHTFEREGTVGVAVDVAWSGSYTVSGYGISFTVPGLATTTSSSLDYEVIEVRSVVDGPEGDR